MDIINRFFKTVFIFFILIFISSTSVYSAVEVFSNYDTILQVNTDNTINVNKTLTLKNVYDVGIVPGQIEFKIGKGTDGSIENLKILNVTAIDKFNKQIKPQIRDTKDYTVIILDVYYPLLPGFEYKFDLNYKLSYNPGGIFFKSLNIPIRESTIPIQQGEFKVILPNNYHFTYLGENTAKISKDNSNIATWQIKNDKPKSISFEYSYLPVKFKNFKGSYTFWITINIILLIILFIEIRKEIKKVREKYEKK